MASVVCQALTCGPSNNRFEALLPGEEVNVAGTYVVDITDATGRGLHSSTFYLNLSCFIVTDGLSAPSVSHKMCFH